MESIRIGKVIKYSITNKTSKFNYNVLWICRICLKFFFNEDRVRLHLSNKNECVNTAKYLTSIGIEEYAKKIEHIKKEFTEAENIVKKTKEEREEKTPVLVEKKEKPLIHDKKEGKTTKKQNSNYHEVNIKQENIKKEFEVKENTKQKHNKKENIKQKLNKKENVAHKWIKTENILRGPIKQEINIKKESKFPNTM